MAIFPPWDTACPPPCVGLPWRRGLPRRPPIALFFFATFGLCAGKLVRLAGVPPPRNTAAPPQGGARALPPHHPPSLVAPPYIWGGYKGISTRMTFSFFFFPATFLKLCGHATHLNHPPRFRRPPLNMGNLREKKTKNKGCLDIAGSKKAMHSSTSQAFFPSINKKKAGCKKTLHIPPFSRENRGGKPGH